MQNPPDFVLFFSCIFLHFFSCVSVCSHVQYIVWDLAVPPNRHLYHPSLYNTPERFWIGEEPMTEITGFRQSVRLFQSYDPVTPFILSFFLLQCCKSILFLISSGRFVIVFGFPYVIVLYFLSELFRQKTCVTSYILLHLFSEISSIRNEYGTR